MHKFNHVPCGFMRLNKDGVIQFVNETTLEWLGYEEEALVGIHFEELLSNVSKTLIYSYFYPTIFIKDKVNELVLKINNAKGVAHSYILNARRFKTEDTVYVDCAFIQMDKRMHYEEELRRVRQLTEQALHEKEEALATLEKLHNEIELKQLQLLEINEELQRKSTTDYLTNVYNRAYFAEFMKEQLIQYEQSKQLFSIIIADIDFFKRVNDSYGHMVGDAVLAQIAYLFKSSIPNEAIVARFGGEEFVIVLPAFSKAQSEEIAGALRLSIEQYEFIDVKKITISLGIATVQEFDTLELMLKKADDALYFVKEHGRNQACHYNDL